jgi:hypothetical protein
MPSRAKATLIATILSVLVLANAAYEFHSMQLHTHLPHWATVLLILPKAYWLAVIWLGWKLVVTIKKPVSGCLVAPLILFAVMLSSLSGYFSHRAADHLFLVYLYGSPRVQTERLHLVRAGQHNPWPVLSEGREIDRITDYEVWAQIDEAVNAAIFFPVCFLVYLLLPRNTSGPIRIFVRY